MRNIFVLLFVGLISSATLSADGDGWKSAPEGRYASSSVLSTGTWVKISVENSGFHKLTYENLQSMGISSPEHVRIHGYGGAMLDEQFSKPYVDDLPEISVYKHKGGDGVFGKGDYILFYAQGPQAWTYTGGCFEHSLNVYSNHGYYFVTSGSSEGKGISEMVGEGVDYHGEINSYTDYYVHELEDINLANSGKEYYGEVFKGTTMNYSYNISVSHLLSSEVSIGLSYAAKSSASSSMTVYNNGQSVYTLPVSTLSDTEYIIKARSAKGTGKFAVTSEDGINLDLRYSNSAAIAWLNYFELNYKRSLIKDRSEVLKFRNVDYLGQEKNFKYNVEGVGGTVQIWDITDVKNISRVSYDQQGTRGSFVASVSELREYAAIDVVNDDFYEPVVVGRVENQDLHSESDVDMLIISNAEFMGAANRLAQWHRDNDGMRVVVTEASKVYNEFSSGTPDATAYRRYAKMFYDRAQSEDAALKYLLLYGDGSFDNRRLLSSATDKDIYRLLTYQSTYSLSSTSSYATDDYFGMLSDTDGSYLASEKMDISVGRIPVYTVEQANVVADKMIEYMNNTHYGIWKNRMVFMADDGDGNEHVKSADAVASLTESLFPDMEIKKVYLDAYNQETTAAGESYPTAKLEFDNYIKEGTLLINYMGHGGYNGWANEQILSSTDIENMYNENLPLWVTATCDFSRFDDFKDSGGERLLFNPNGGAIALFTTSRTVYAGPNKNLNLKFMEALLTKDNMGRQVTLGEAVRLAKNGMIGDSNRMSFVLLGNPAMKLNIPDTHRAVLDSINSVVYEANVSDTIKALQEVKLSGSMVDEEGVVDRDFTGVVYVSVYDKEESLTTLCNDDNSMPFTFDYRNNKLFYGSAEVVNGEFYIEFRLPKDIRYNYGSARIVMYAYDEENGYEANGSTEGLIVGGEDDNIIYEEQGPEVEMYMNSDNFRSGDIVNSSPLFIAKVEDESGINTIGSGIGHDIILRLNNDSQQEYVLNSYYRSVVGNYRQGEVNYKLKDLPDGRYELLFRVWDLQNNSTTSTMEFEVSNEIGPELYNVYSYPNPTTDYVNFVVSHNRPSTPIDVRVEIYDLTGKYVWTSGKKVITDNSGESLIHWDLQASSGDRVGPGVYLSRIEIIDLNGEVDVKMIKILVK